MTPNKFRGEVVIELDRQRKLHLTLDAVCRAEQACDISLMDLQPFKNVRTFRGFLFAALIDDDPQITPKHVADLIDDAMRGKKYQDLCNAVLAAWQAAWLPEQETQPVPDDETKNA